MSVKYYALRGLSPSHVPGLASVSSHLNVSSSLLDLYFGFPSSHVCTALFHLPSSATDEVCSATPRIKKEVSCPSCSIFTKALAYSDDY